MTTTTKHQTTVELTGGDLGSESMAVRCDLTQSSAMVEVDYRTGDGWQHTQYECADCNHRNSGLIDIGKRLAAAAVEMSADDFNCDAETIEPEAMAIIKVIEHRDTTFTGGNISETVQSWLDAGFNADSASKWMDVGFWDADTAARLRDENLEPSDVEKTADRLIEECYDAKDCWTDGSPIYALCNGDYSLGEFIDECRSDI